MEPKVYLLVFDVKKNEYALTALNQYVMDSNYLPTVQIIADKLIM
jgi:hypothetical protein